VFWGSYLSKAYRDLVLKDIFKMETNEILPYVVYLHSTCGANPFSRARRAQDRILEDCLLELANRVRARRRPRKAGLANV